MSKLIFLSEFAILARQINGVSNPEGVAFRGGNRPSRLPEPKPYEPAT